MSGKMELRWTPVSQSRFRVRSLWWELVWHPAEGLTQLQFNRGPSRLGECGIQGVGPEGLAPSDAKTSSSGAVAAIPGILGLSRLELGEQFWDFADLPPDEIVIQENRITASWLASDTRPAEVYGRWVLEGCRFWLEISVLTPRRLEKVALETRTELGSFTASEIPGLHPRVRCVLAQLHDTPDWSYLELGRTDEVTAVAILPAGLIRFRLFDAGLEKGVVLRGRVLATFVRRDSENILASQIAQDFAQAPPNLTR